MNNKKILKSNGDETLYIDEFGNFILGYEITKTLIYIDVNVAMKWLDEYYELVYKIKGV